MASLEETLTSKLKAALSPESLNIDDVSGGCGVSFTLHIVSCQFEGKSLLERHRLVNSTLREELPKLHALTLKCLTPAEAAQK